MDGSLTVANSLFIDGQWFTAQWMGEVADPETGELVITATVKGPGPCRVAALRLGMETVRDLRATMGFEGLLPGERAEAAEADLRYWRESVQFAVDMLRRGRGEGQGPLLKAANDAESYLRQLLELDGVVDAEAAPGMTGVERYDLRTVEDRLATPVARLAWMTEIERRMDSDQDKLVQQYAGLSERIFTIEERNRKAAERAQLGLLGAEYMKDQYDAEHDASKISYWDMQLLAMIETVNARLASLGGG